MAAGQNRSPGALLAWLRAPAPIIVLQVFVALLLLARAVIVFGAEPFFEEAYYWLWGQHPALSYVDHPPLNAWLLGLSSLVLGWNLFALRAIGWLSLAATAWLLWLWSGRLGGTDGTRWFWTALVIYLAAPIFSLFTAVVFPDHLLVPLCLGVAYAAARFVEEWEAGRPAYRYLWLAAILLGLAGLTKYNTVLLAVALLAYLVTMGPRAVARNWRLYAAVVLVAAIVSPVAIWNAANGFPTLQFHLRERETGITGAVDVSNLKWFAFFALLTVSPLLFGPLVRLLLDRRWREPFARAGHGIAAWAFLISTTTFAIASLFAGVFPHWNIVAYVTAFAFLPRYVTSGWHVVAHALFGLAVTAVFAANYAVAPIRGIPGVHGAATTSYGWSEIAQAVDAAVAEHQPGFVATSDIGSAAQLGFAMKRTDVVPLSDTVNQYRYWFDPSAHAGERAVVLSGLTLNAKVTARFESVRRIGEVTVERFGETLARYGIWLGIGFRG